MQAIILAAGMGRRLGDYTRDNTKCMLPVGGVRLIDRMLTQLSALNLQRVVIVTGYKAANLTAHIGHRYDDRLRIEYVYNPDYDKTNNIYSLFLARQKMQEDDTLLLESDLIFEDSLLQLITADARPNLALVAKYETWMDGTMVRLDADDNIVSFVTKQAFRYEHVDTYYKTVNIYKFSREFSRQRYVPFLEAYCRAVGYNEYYEQVLRVITFLSSDELKALPIGSRKWYEIDDAQDRDIAETIFSEGPDQLRRYARRYGGHWRFPQMLDFCYLVNPYFPTPRMHEEMRANFSRLLCEYPSGQGVNDLLGGKCFGLREQYVAVGNGAAELIKALMEILPGRLGLTLPTFQEYPNRRSKADVVAFVPKEEGGYRYTAEDLKAFFGQQDISTLLLINPDNPSGNYIPQRDVVELARWCEARGVRLIVDESFVDFAADPAGANATLLQNELLQQHPKLVVLKSISKSYGVPGLRLGLLASSDEELLTAVRRNLSIWNINSFAEFFLQIYNKYTAAYERACELFRQERARFEADLKQIVWLETYPSQANYFLCHVNPAVISSTRLAQRLLSEHNILIKDCDTKSGLEGRNYIRIAVRNEADNKRLVAALKGSLS